MDVVTLLENISQKFGTIFGLTWGLGLYRTHEVSHILLITVLILICSTTVYLIRKWKKKVVNITESISGGAAGSRFRKRDKALFYGRKMLRKVKSISGQVRSGQGKKRKMVMKFARKILQLKKENEAEQLKVLEPPAEYLQEDILSDDRIPSDALYLLKSLRVFGNFEKPVFLKLCKKTEIIEVDAGQYLFKVGEFDEHMYVVQKGKLNVWINGPDLHSLSLKVVKSGESVTSLLSFIDVLMGNPSVYKTVAARAIEDSTVVKLPMSAFLDVFEESPDILIRIIQVIMVRLCRVTFTALHQYLGLSMELFSQKTARSKRALSTYTMSPVKSKISNEPIISEVPLGSTTSQPIPVLRPRKKPVVEVFSPSPDLGSSSEYTEIPPFDNKKRHSIAETVDDESLINAAMEAFVKDLGLDDDSLLKGNVHIRDIQAGNFVNQDPSIVDVPLIYVISGSFIVMQRHTDQQEDVMIFTAHSGEIVGGLAVLTGEHNLFNLKAKHFARYAFIYRSTFYKLVKDNPRVVLHVAHLVVRRLSSFVRQVDFALDWVFLESGRAVYRQDDDSDSTYIVLSGRLRSVITQKNGKKEVVAEYGKGDLIGIVEMVTQTRRSTTVIAVRDTELAKLPEGLFNIIKLRYPIVVTRLIKLLGHRILGSWQKSDIIPNPKSSTVDSRPSQLNFSTVAIVPVSDDVPLAAFTYELYHCLSAIGSTLRLTSEVIRKLLGPGIMDSNNEYRLTTWLAQQEDQYHINLYQCDTTFSLWTQRCIRQADCVLIVGLGGNLPSLGKTEKEVERLAVRTQKELVLLHKEDGSKPLNTVTWLNMRSWISSHHHILCPKRMFSRKSVFRINELYSKVCLSEPNIHSDFSRLARWLTGKSVGLVLGGGGARGSAHVGMIKAITEAGIPIDMVGGVSIGAFMGGLWCQERNITTVTQKARQWSKKMTQWWRQLLDLTYPMTSMFSGKDFNHTIKSTFGETFIEDLWLPFFTVTTDISSSCMRIHHHGSLWRYVRSSMSLSGYMPPLCDPADGHLLLDGGYTNNLPADVMRSLGANHIIAIDVGSEDDQNLTNYGDDLSGWWLLWKRWNPFTTPVKVPNLPDIQSRLAYVSCVKQLEEVKHSGYCEYIRPPIDKFRTLQFGSFDEIKDVGYQHGKTYFEGKTSWSLQFQRNKSQIQMEQPQPPPDHIRYTFTDLAQMVCKVREYDESSSAESSDEYDEDNHGYASEPSAGILDGNSHSYPKRGYGSLSENELESDIREFDRNLRRVDRIKEV